MVIDNFFSKKHCIINKHNAKHLKKISEELMPVAWHPKGWWNFCLKEDEKKKK